MKIKSAFFILSLSLISILSSCKKETNEIAYPFKEIKSFVVPGVDGADLSVAVDNNTLTLYWPGTSAIPAEITPQIKVSERAKVLPASGTKVALKDGVTYTVTAEDGSTATYTLKLVNNQPPPSITETAVTLNGYGSVQIAANYLIPDLNRTKAYLVDGTGKEVQIIPVSVTRQTFTLIPDSYDQANTPPAGKYKLKIVSGDKSTTSITDFITLARPFAGAYIYNAGPNPLTVKRGTRITLPVRNLAGKTITRLTWNAVRLTVVGPTADNTGILLDLPATFATGDYNSIQLAITDPATGLSGNIAPVFNTPIRVTE